MTRIWFDPEARAEYVGAAAHYKAESLHRGREFAHDFRTALDQITTFPLSYAADSDGVRKKPLRHFPYTLVYRANEDVLEILALSHQSRNPGYWRDRL